MHLWISLSVWHNHLFFWRFASVRTKKEPRMKRKIHFSLMLSPSLLTAPLFLSYFFYLTLSFMSSSEEKENSRKKKEKMPLREASRKWPFRGISHFSSHKIISRWLQSHDTSHIYNVLQRSWLQGTYCPTHPTKHDLNSQEGHNIFCIMINWTAMHSAGSRSNCAGSSLVNYRLRIQVSGVGVSSLWVCFCSLQFSEIPFPFP